MNQQKKNNSRVTVSNPDKVLFPEDGFTKKDLDDYYGKISEVQLPYLKDRPMMLQRFPDGIGEKGFYQKAVSDYFPDWIDRITVDLKKEGHEKQELVNCNKKETLLYCVNQASITPHIWLSKKDKLDHPDKMIYDLDPPDGKFDVVRQCARDLKDLFDTIGLDAFVMTTGSKGLHVVVPLAREWNYDRVREFAKMVARYLVQEKPSDYTVATVKQKRKGRLFIDYLRNAFGQTTVAPFSVRPKKGAPIATPLSWDELKITSLDAQSYHLKNIFRRLGKKEDPWSKFGQTHNHLFSADKKLNDLQEKP